MIAVESRLLFFHAISICEMLALPHPIPAPFAMHFTKASILFTIPHSSQSSNHSTPWVACHYRPCASALISSRIRCANASSLACRRANSSRSFACASAATSHTTGQPDRSAWFLISPSTVPHSMHAFGPKPTMPETRQDKTRAGGSRDGREMEQDILGLSLLLYSFSLPRKSSYSR